MRCSLVWLRFIVSDNFNESRSIALSIYNVLFSSIVIVAIGFLQSGMIQIMELVSVCLLVLPVACEATLSDLSLLLC